MKKLNKNIFLINKFPGYTVYQNIQQVLKKLILKILEILMGIQITPQILWHH